MAIESVLKIESLNLWYKEFYALKNIDTEIYPNKITALIGPSGCGKSSFLRCLNRLNEEIIGVKIKGKVIFKGQNIYDGIVDPVLIRKQIGMVFQRPNPFPGMSIFDNVATGLKLNGYPKKEIEQRVVESIKQSGLFDEVKDKLNKDAMGLSGGQQQRLCIARAIAINPEIILMDEPTSALDPVATSKIEELMIELKKDFSVVVVTHNMQQAKRVSDEIIFFLHGEILEKNSTEEFFKNPLNEKSRQYIMTFD